MDHLPLHHPAKMIGFMRFHHLAGDPFGIVPFDEFLDSKGAMFPRAVINSKNLEPRTGFVRVGEDDGGHGDWLSRRRHSLLSVLPCSNSGSPPVHYSPVSHSKGAVRAQLLGQEAARPWEAVPLPEFHRGVGHGFAPHSGRLAGMAKTGVGAVSVCRDCRNGTNSVEGKRLWAGNACRYTPAGVKSGLPRPAVIARAGLRGEMSEVPAG